MEVAYLDFTSYLDVLNFSFLCSGAGGECSLCHYSCNCDGAGLCLSCKDSTLTPDPLLNACHCSGNTGSSGGIYSVACAPCDSNCATCNLAGDPNSCLTCKAANASVQDILGGTCPCPITNVIPGTTCDPCPNDCPYCVDSDPASCMSKAEVDFALTATSLYGLPTLSEQNASICYRTRTASHDKSRCALEAVLGTLVPGAITLTTSQCYKLLNSEWTMLAYWFTNIFSNFAPPNTLSDAEKLKIKTVLELWLLQFSPASLKQDPDWQPLVAAFNDISADWTRYLGWARAPRGFTLDGTATLLFPAELDTWLGTENRDLVALNVKSTVCDASGCGFAHECWSINPALACSVAPQ